jgi:Fur family peroxide stress response transcriptional regulator
VPTADVDRRVETFLGALRARGLKVTHQRTEVFRELARSDEHPDAETLYRRVRAGIPAISRDTVYRTLDWLVSQGLARKVDALHERARFDANLDRHHHFVCTACGAVRDFTSPGLDALHVPRAVRAWGNVDVVQVQVRGTCRRCQAGRKRKAKRRGASRPR